MARGVPSEWTEELASRLAAYAKDLRGVDLESVLDAQVLSELIRGRRTVPELVGLLYGVQHGYPGYNSYYMKVRRSLQNLGGKGYVSCPIFGKNRPYRLTGYAIAKLTNIGGEGSPRRVALVPRKDLAVYVATTLLGCLSLASGVDAAVEAWTYLVFAFLLGIATGNAARTLVRVI